MSSAAPLLELRHVSKRFGAYEALADVDLRIFPGERVALVGPSGAGKSTMLGLLNGTLMPTTGEVRIFGQDLARLSPRAVRDLQRQIGTIHQQFHLVGSLKVIHNVNAGHLGRWSLLKAAVSLFRPLEVETAATALEQVGIRDKLYERTDRLSGGEQQRVALARVTVQNPRVILADEPIASLDPEHSRAVMDLLRDLTGTDGRTSVASLHDFKFALSHCERLVGLRRGRVLFDAPVARVSKEMVTGLYSLEQ